MNKTVLYSAISFLIGSALGAVGTYVFKMKKYDSAFRKRQEEMEAYYKKKQSEPQKPIEPAESDGHMIPIKIEKKTNMMEEARKIAADQGYIKKQYSKIKSEDEEESLDDIPTADEVINDKPYVIDMNEFGTQEMYEIETWHLYSDGVITDETNAPVDMDDVMNTVSYSAIDTLKNSNKDCVYVRNERLRKDFEIIEEIGRYDDE